MTASAAAINAIEDVSFGPAASKRDWAAWTTVGADGRRRLELAVDNVDCAACMGDIERAAARIRGVASPRLNLTTRRLTVALERDDADLEGLLTALDAVGHPARPFDPALARGAASTEMRRLLTSLATAGFGAMNVMMLSVAIWSGNVTDITPETRDFFHAVSALIALPCIAVAGRPFFSSAWRAVRRGGVTMDLPISVGVTLATAYSFVNTLTRQQEAYFDSALMLLFFLLCGRVLDELMRRRTALEAETLAALRTDTAVKIEPTGELVETPASKIAPGDLVLVRPGERAPVDGVIARGASEFDLSIMTGETTPVAAVVGTEICAGACNGSGAVELRASRPASGSFLDEVERLLRAAGDARSRTRRLADRVARFYTPVVHLGALSTLIGWLAAGADWRTALVNAIAVLIITCPCALALAIPAVQVVAAGRLFRDGVLLNAGDAIERFATVDTVLFDKTGTLTEPERRITDLADIDPALAGRAARLASRSRHPLARALAMAAGATENASATEVVERPGQGVEGRVDGRRARLGSPTFCGVAATKLAAAEERRPRATFIAYREDDSEPTLIAVEQRIRPDARDAVAALRKAGLAIEIISGDRPDAVASVAAELGVGRWRARQTPADKIARLEQLKASGRRTLMVGDGMNDAPALAAAHASLAPASGVDVAQVAADAVLLDGRLKAVPDLLAISRCARSAMIENLAFAIVYNVAAVPIAVTGHASPLVAALAMSGSSLVVTVNALRLRSARAVSGGERRLVEARA
ncbi:heavy metal translocating P-type ATPase [Hansschlegelia zhihuaiae]|uniref:Cadmium-translocating P-type ATPase n=1 Tax=Hansschlegelia zhihuaiae TaxID=405005 RepID=A0A4Q0MI04_9HYPH|nr:heavy metal translocating P-type ATPase [Hansschlegelia zhihuaiae]RXF73170.1 cadmium-translocating P-type ATPase [Hansschlegelia zhihuaiae]